MRFFRTPSDELYEGIRLQLDAAWGLTERGCTCITPAAEAPRDSEGRIVLAVDTAFTEFEAVAAMLPGLLASEQVVEITREEYMEAIAPSEGIL